MRRGRACARALRRGGPRYGRRRERDRQGHRGPRATADRPAAHRFGAATSPEIQGLATSDAAARVRLARRAGTRSSSSASARSTAPGTRSSRARKGRIGTPRRVSGRQGPSGRAAKRLPAIADLGFDVVYLTPIHPIGTTARKGRNNSLSPEPDEPGSPYAIGSPDGGHDAIHPDLGSFEDFDFFVAEAGRHGLEVALDFALQASPDHPWVQSHPELFTTRADGTIAYAENPPKKYQDIYPLNFDNDPGGRLRGGAAGHPGVARPRRRASSASTTRTRSRLPSGSGSSPTSPGTIPRRSGCPRRSRSRR